MSKASEWFNYLVIHRPPSLSVKLGDTFIFATVNAFGFCHITMSNSDDKRELILSPDIIPELAQWMLDTFAEAPHAP